MKWTFKQTFSFSVDFNIHLRRWIAHFVVVSFSRVLKYGDSNFEWCALKSFLDCFSICFKIAVFWWLSKATLTLSKFFAIISRTTIFLTSNVPDFLNSLSRPNFYSLLNLVLPFSRLCFSSVDVIFSLTFLHSMKALFISTFPIHLYTPELITLFLSTGIR